MGELKNIVLNEIERVRGDILKEIDKEKNNAVMGRILDSLDKNHRRDVKYNNLLKIEKGNRTIQTFINKLNFRSVKDINEIYNSKVKQFAWIDAPKGIFYYDEDIYNLSTTNMVYTVMSEIINAYTYWTYTQRYKSTLHRHLKEELIDGTINTEDVSLSYDKEHLRHNAYRELGKLMRAVGYIDWIGENTLDRYIEIINYFNDDKVILPIIDDKKVRTYYLNITEDEEKTKKFGVIRVGYSGIHIVGRGGEVWG